ncbi:hypothetical protein EsH8_IX_000973 [Colletotrichum jinshuiense]
MTVVAVAGGTGGIGKTIIEQLVLSGKHEVLVLSRHVPDHPSQDGAQLIRADYGDVGSLTSLLELNNVNTVISAIGMHSEETEKAQLNLIEAAKQSEKTKRFIPSEYGACNTLELAKSEPYAMVWVRAAEALKASGLQYTRFVNGFFMDYWGMPHIKSHMPSYIWVFDIANSRAAIPGTGENVISVTYTIDVARFVVRSLEVDDWPEFSIVVGTDLTLLEALAMIENVRRKTFSVTYDTEEDLQQNKATVWGGYDGVPTEELAGLNAMFGRMAVGGHLMMPRENRLSDKHPDIRPLTVKELLAKTWAKQP